MTKKPAPSTRETIIAAAENRMKRSGFHGTSFRDIAKDVGIKSASVHHHFPTKEDLAAVVVRAYADREINQLGDPHDVKRKPMALIGAYIDLFRCAARDENSMCLCGLLAGEAASLPERVNNEVQSFFDRNLEWTEAVVRRALPGERPRDVKAKALMLTAALEGALLGVNCRGDVGNFEKIAGELKAALSPGRGSV